MLVGARHPGATVGVVEKEHRVEVRLSLLLIIFLYLKGQVRDKYLVIMDHNGAMFGIK